MKKWILTALALSALVLPAAAFASKGSLLQKFGAGEVTIQASSATIKNDPGEWGGVYSKDSLKKSKLNQVTFKFTTDGGVQGGAPRWSIPIDTTPTNADQHADDYAFLDAANCGAKVGTNDAKVVTVVSTDNPNCKVFLDTRSWETGRRSRPTPTTRTTGSRRRTSRSSSRTPQATTTSTASSSAKPTLQPRAGQAPALGAPAEVAGRHTKALAAGPFALPAMI